MVTDSPRVNSEKGLNHTDATLIGKDANNNIQIKLSNLG